MLEFWAALANHSFLQKALLAGILAGVACGVVGTYVVTRRITYIGGGISHSVLGGMGAAYFLAGVHGITWLNPFVGATVAALLSALIIGWVSLKAAQREDTVISVIWAVVMAIGIIFIAKTPGYNENLMSYLFGNILMVGGRDLWLMAALDVIIIVIVGLFYNQFLGVCFDEEFARVRGLRVEFYYLLLLCLTALTVVLLVTVVGVVMVVALLSLPAATASFFARTLKQNMVVAVLLSILVTVLGLALSYGPDLPAGATIILTAGVVYILAAVAAHLRH